MLRTDRFWEGGCYCNVVLRKELALHLLDRCYKVFKGASRIRKLDKLLALYNDAFNGRGIQYSTLYQSLDLPALDAFRIITCFENFFKAKLLFDGYIIHQVDKNIDITLHKRQRRRPIAISELGSDIFRVLSLHTVDLQTLMSSKYKKQLGMPPELFESLKHFRDMRNNIHYLIAGVASMFDSENIIDLLCVRSCFNEYIIALHKDIIKNIELNHPIGGKGWGALPMRRIGPLKKTFEIAVWDIYLPPDRETH